MRTLHQTLKLQHHQHTGKLLHHRHTSYRGLVVVLALAGVFMVGLHVSAKAAADEFGVSAWVNIPAASTAPVIASPAANAVITGSSLLVTGTCPLVSPQVVVSVNIDGAAAGTGACDPNNDFSIPVTVGGGNHKITASSYAVDGLKGPVSQSVAITSQTKTLPSGVVITPDQPFLFADGRQAVWTGTIGARGTQYVHLDWGDGSQNNYAVQAGAQHFSHTYKTAGSHNVMLSAADDSGTSGTLQVASATLTNYTAPPRINTPVANSRTTVGLYGLYVTTVCVAAIIWLEAKHAARQAAV
ncbi:MAG TPA: hypothetical protein VGM08_05000 [Candidatus Saccharimonadales bacterium]|jgi:hypothetical protein